MTNKYFLLTITSLLYIQTAIADEYTLIPNLSASVKNFEYSVLNGNVKGEINSLGAGITGIYKNFYFDLNGERSQTANEESLINGLSNTIAFKRTDFTASIGYAINQSISVFTGYKYGNSTLTELPHSPYVGAKTSLEGKGIFIGAGGGWAIKNWGHFSFSAAFAKMIANYKSFNFGTTEGDANGTSLAIKWQAPITDHLSYDLSIKRHDYYYENFDQINIDVSEQILSFKVGVSYKF